MKTEINRDDLRCLILGKYLLSNEFTFDSNNAKNFLEGALFMFDFLQRNKELPLSKEEIEKLDKEIKEFYKQ